MTDLQAHPGGDAQQILAVLRAAEPQLRAQGILHAALFGSRARGDARAGSDIDIMIETGPDSIPDMYAYAGLKAAVAGLFPGPVDVVNRDFLNAAVRAACESELLYAF